MSKPKAKNIHDDSDNEREIVYWQPRRLPGYVILNHGGQNELWAEVPKGDPRAGVRVNKHYFRYVRDSNFQSTDPNATPIV